MERPGGERVALMSALSPQVMRLTCNSWTASGTEVPLHSDDGRCELEDSRPARPRKRGVNDWCSSVSLLTLGTANSLGSNAATAIEQIICLCIIWTEGSVSGGFVCIDEASNRDRSQAASLPTRQATRDALRLPQPCHLAGTGKKRH